MLEITIQGSRGQGVQSGCRILADAFIQAGASVRAVVAPQGRESDGAVVGSVHVDWCPTNGGGDDHEIHHLLLLDSAYLAPAQDNFPLRQGIIVVNSSAAPCWRMPGAAWVVAVDAAAIAGQAGLGPLVASAVIGAFARATGLLGLGDLVEAVNHGCLDQKGEQVAACTMAYRDITAAPPQ
jgi:Pyruvate/2-oxoacid:ferredoxin oxidoreductase gamma subunit